MSKHVVLVGLAAALTATAAAAQPAQYSSKDIVDTFAKKPAAAGAPTDPCAAKGMVTGEDGVCEPAKNARGFSLPTRANLHAAATPASAAHGTATHARTVASASTPRPAPVAAAPAGEPRRNLLITFKLGSSELTDQAKANAKVFAQALQSPALAGDRFAIDGYTDARGDKAKNQALSDERAASVKSFLVSQGVSDARLEAHGHGATDFAVPSAPTSPANRRVEARLLN